MRATAPAPSADIDTDLARGLTSDEAQRRLAEFGANALEEKKVTLLDRLIRYFWGPIPWMIEAAAILSLVLKDWNDFAIITLMLLINAGVSYWQEAKAEDAIKVLKKQLAPLARVLRDGTWATIAARELVPGDVVALKIGDVTPADLKLVSGDYLSTDESALTGESLPVDKKVGDPAYSGSIVKLGAMDGIVTATGTKTYFGRTAQLVQTAVTRSHFQRAVLRIGNFLIMSTIALVVLILLVSLYREEPFLETLQFCLILTVAAIPVALPAVLSVTMAIGAERIARMKAVVSRLVAIEELAGIDVLCADKTGTLTKNQLTLGDPMPAQGEEATELLAAAALASDRDNPDAIDHAVLIGWEKKQRKSAAGDCEVHALRSREQAHRGRGRTQRQEGSLQQGRTPGHLRSVQAPCCKARRLRAEGRCAGCTGISRTCGRRDGRRKRLAHPRPAAALRSAARRRRRDAGDDAQDGRRRQDGDGRPRGDRQTDRRQARVRGAHPRRRQGVHRGGVASQHSCADRAARPAWRAFFPSTSSRSSRRCSRAPSTSSA